jgi:sensor c-di-GMP phosphodiesterase-like protein
LARTLETGVVAEGVESAQQANQLERLGCRYAQGFFFSAPLAACAIERLLAVNKPLGNSKAPRSVQQDRTPMTTDPAGRLAGIA